MTEFDQFAKDYRSLHNHNIQISGANSAYFSKFKAIEVARIEHQPVRLLDLGCGDGLVSEYLSGQFPNTEIHGLDISGESIEVAAERGIANATFKVYDGHAIPYSPETFDVILIAGVFHHIPSFRWPSLLLDIFRVSTPGARVHIFEHNPYNPATRYIVSTCVFDKDVVLVNASELKSRCKEAGFTNIKQKNLLFFPRHKLLKPFLKLELYLSWLTLGAQYRILAIKPHYFKTIPTK